MTSADRWARIGALFDAAVEKRPAEREAVVRASAEPRDIQDEVLSLLAAHDTADDFLATPPARSAAARPESLASYGETSPKRRRFQSREGGPAQPALPAQLGHYRIHRIVGEGGMGIVYQAEDTRLHRIVALKLLSPSLAGDQRQRERLKQEARAAAALTHPNIATVYALEEIDDHIAIASEYVDGESLRSEIDRGPIPSARALDIAIDIARALAAAHERGIVHRDLKPENIICTREGVLKIVDFGLAQFAGTARELVSMTLTDTGMVAGTPPYMAPEQLLGQPTDFRTDHFAFGVVLYELLTGRHPFGGKSLPSTIARILAVDIEPPAPDSNLRGPVWDIVRRSLEKNASARFASSQELVAALTSVQTASASARPAPPASYGGTSLQTGASSGDIGAQWWWHFHQLAAATIYWGMVWPAWHVHRSIGRAGLFFFFAMLAAVVVSANLRIHLWFSARVYPQDLAQQRADTYRWIRAADCAFVALLVAGGLLLPEDRAGWAALLISVGIGSAVAFLIIEPATTRAAFRRERGESGPANGGRAASE
jgi:predicted Ser/Thr protein kinase